MREHLGVREMTSEEQTYLEQLARFNETGIGGFLDRPRAGWPPTYTAEQHAEVITAALTKPDDLGLPFDSLTLDRLQAYLHVDIAAKGARHRHRP